MRRSWTPSVSSVSSTSSPRIADTLGVARDLRAALDRLAGSAKNQAGRARQAAEAAASRGPVVARRDGIRRDAGGCRAPEAAVPGSWLRLMGQLPFEQRD